MASGGVTTTGLKEMRAGVESLPTRVTAALRAVAWRTSRHVMAGAKSRLIAQQKTSARQLANEIHVIEEADRKQFVVVSDAPANQPANVPIWNEHGTVKMTARPYMRPAALAESDQYKREMETGSIDAVREALG